jgi:hypothetical protein
MINLIVPCSSQAGCFHPADVWQALLGVDMPSDICFLHQQCRNRFGGT